MGWLGWGGRKYRILVVKPLGKRPIGRLRGWEGNIKIDLNNIDCEAENGWNWCRIVSNGKL
jgi:hypothetical protein